MSAIRYALVLGTLTLSFAGQTPVAAAGKSAPLTFACKHCNLKMTIKQSSDLKKKCWVCMCKKAASACKPSAKK